MISKMFGNLHKQKILVTGASGYIGRNLVEKLESLSAKYLCVGYAELINNRQDTLAKINEFQPTNIVHLAGRTNPVESWEFLEEYLKANTVFTGSIAETWRALKCDLIYVNTYIYGNPEKLPIKESDPVSPMNPYALSKMFAEDLLRFCAKSFSLNCTSLRVFNLFGGIDNNPERLLIDKILHQYSEGYNVIRLNSKFGRRDYLHVDDLINAILLSFDNKKGFRVLNIGSGKSYSPVEIFDIVKEASQGNIELEILNLERKGEVRDIVCDPTMAYREIGWESEVNLRDWIVERVRKK